MPRSSDRRPRDGRPGVRIGPMVFVPEFTSSAGDPWAHRKGEPRLFTLMWAIYLMLGAMGTIFATRTIGPPTPSSYRSGCLAMVTIVAAGATVLWPLVRLSQRTPSRPIASVWIDLAVILLPIQSVIWPMPLLTKWPWQVAATMALIVTGWTMAIGAITAGSISRPPSIGRAATMALICALVFGGPAIAMAEASRGWGAAPVALLASPITAGWEIARSAPNLRPTVSRAEVWAGVAPAVVACLLWAPFVVRKRIVPGD